MARLAVETYLASLQGEKQHMARKRVQAGMVLAEGLPTTPWSPIELECVDIRYRPKMMASPLMPSELEVAELLCTVRPDFVLKASRSKTGSTPPP